MKEIPLSQGYKTIVSDEDFEWLSQWKWYTHFNKNRTPYAFRHGPMKNGVRSRIPLHRLILGLTDKSLDCDHIDGDTLNNQRHNLRACTRSENNCNTRSRKGSTSKYKGVSRYHNGKWQVSIGNNKKSIWLGVFDSEIDAALAYNEAAKKYHGEFARLNELQTA